MILVSEPEFQRLLQKATKEPDTAAVTLEQPFQPEPSVPVNSELSPKVIEPETSKTGLIELLPPRLKSGGIQLLAAFHHRFTPDQFSWNSKTGEVTIEGNKISNSNISDLIGAILQPFQKADLRGLDRLVSLFKSTNFPTLLVRNRKIRQTLLTIPETIPEQEEEISPPTTIVPAKKARKWIKW